MRMGWMLRSRGPYQRSGLLFRSNAAAMYKSSAGWPKWHHPTGLPGPENGSMFLVSQSNYLRGLNCSEAEFHFICTERFDSDWNTVLLEFGLSPEPPQVPSRKRSGFLAGPIFFAEQRSWLDEVDKNYVRDTLYPWDTALYRAVCTNGAQGGAHSKTSIPKTY